MDMTRKEVSLAPKDSPLRRDAGDCEARDNSTGAWADPHRSSDA